MNEKEAWAEYDKNLKEKARKREEESAIMTLNHTIIKLGKEIKRLVTLRDTMRRKYDNATKCGGVHSTPTRDLSRSRNKFRGEGS